MNPSSDLHGFIGLRKHRVVRDIVNCWTGIWHCAAVHQTRTSEVRRNGQPAESLKAAAMHAQKNFRESAQPARLGSKGSSRRRELGIQNRANTIDAIITARLGEDVHPSTEEAGRIAEGSIV